MAIILLQHQGITCLFFQLVARQEKQLLAQSATHEDLSNEKEFVATQLSSEKRKLLEAQIYTAELQRKVLMYISCRNYPHRSISD